MAVQLSGGHTGTVLCVDAQTNGIYLASGAENGELCLWTFKGELCKKVTPSEADCTSICFSATKNDLLYASFGNRVCVLDLKNLDEIVESYSFNEDEINQIRIDEEEKFLAACDDSGEIKVIDLQNKKLYKTLRNKHNNICSTLCFRPKRSWEMFTGGLDSKLIHWNFSRPKCLNQFNMQELHFEDSAVDAYLVNPPLIHSLDCSSDGKYLACALGNSALAIFDSTRKNIRERFSLHGHLQGVSQVQFMNDSLLFSGSNDCCIILWDLSKSNQAQQENGQPLANGHSAEQEITDSSFTNLCKVSEIQHTSKINWLKPFQDNGQHRLAIVDQTPIITILPIHT